MDQLLAVAALKEDSLVTLYYGQEVSPPQAEETSRRIRERFPQVEVEVAHGGQPSYPYLLSIE